MKKILHNIFIILILTTGISFAKEVNKKVIKQIDFENKTVYLPLNNFRTLKFEQPVKNIQLTNSENIRAEFIENDDYPLMYLKVLGKVIGNESASITLYDGTSMHINFNIMQNLDSIVSLAKAAYPKLVVEQANDTILLKGFVKDYKEKDLVLDIFKKASIDLDKQLVDMIKTSSPSKMIRVKLYAVEVNNDRGLDIKNNWMVSSKNYMTVTDGDKYYNEPLGSFPANNVVTGYRYETQPDGTVNVIPTEYKMQSSASRSSVNNQRMKELEDSLNGVMTNAVSLTGGLTGMANYLGKYFNVGLVLKYLSTKEVANVLDESTLLTLENKESSFHAGGSIRVRTESATAGGIPTSEIEVIDYGLKMEIKAKNIMNDEYIDLEINTSSTKIDWANKVDNIPSFLEKKVKTNVLVRNKATIVLGGLVNNENSNDIDKIPVLGDIPILGFLFKSKAFKEGKSELVFFITPEVVDPTINNQVDFFKKKRTDMLNIEKVKAETLEEEKKAEEKIKQKDIDNLFDKMFKEKKVEKTAKELEEERVNKILGYE